MARVYGPAARCKRVLPIWRMWGYMILDRTNWTFWVTTLALVAFGFCLRVLYERWYFRKVRNEVHDEVRDRTRRLQTATEQLNQGKCKIKEIGALKARRADR